MQHCPKAIGSDAQNIKVVYECFKGFEGWKWALRNKIVKIQCLI